MLSFLPLGTGVSSGGYSVSLRGNCCSLAWKLLFPYVDTVVSLRVYSCFLAWKLPVSVAEAEAAPGACYGNSV
ncbi:hypothetical protein [Bacteroides stercoris]|uniref:hypothetical protein n=1 Tax=Bacteroides stercoris TaxID=46506 RepID=UPI000E54C129|nr:hypothetical protein [Bacteroides stercoris]MDC2304405.1 hypothetical protein [Bacteroides stercoris]MDC2304875.1 hypothetical protein [Bacteroides stercoris]